MIALIVAIAINAAVAADTACAEASQDYEEGELVLAVAHNRAVAFDLPLWRVLVEPRQFAHGCPPWRMTWRHYALGVRAALGWLRRPEWLTPDVHWFCAPHVESRWRAPGRWSSRMVVAGRGLHLFWRMP